MLSSEYSLINCVSFLFCFVFVCFLVGLVLDGFVCVCFCFLFYKLFKLSLYTSPNASPVFYAFV